jgi:hypothetical protein
MSKKLSKKSFTLITLSLLVALALFSYSAVRYEQHRVSVNQHNAAVAKIASDAEKARTDLITIQTVSIASLKAQRDAACQYIATVAQSKAGRGIVTVPVLPCAK